MPISNNIPTVNFTDATAMCVAAMDANVVPLLIGDPGVGKSALAYALARSLSLPLEVLIGSTLDPTDVGGLPVLSKGKSGLDRIPLEIIRRCCDVASLLFIDEVAMGSGPVQAALLRVIFERVAGDRTLHPDTRIIVATNPEEQTPAGSPLSAPLVGRVMMFHLRPSNREVTEWFMTLGDDGSTLRAEATDFALTCGVQPDLLQIDIPSSSVLGNEPWGAPRAWERAVRMRSVLTDPNAKHVATAANVGEQVAASYKAILALRNDLPSVEEIVKAPATARVPSVEEKKKQISAIGLVPRVADVDHWAAWIYVSRLAPEISTACARHLMARKPSDKDNKSTHYKAGLKARVEVAKVMTGE